MTHRGNNSTPTTEARLTALLDRAEIAGLIDRYVTALDTADEHRTDEWYLDLFTEDVRLSFPIGDWQGIVGLSEFHRRARLRWEVTLHLSGGHTVAVDGDRALARANVAGTHIARGAAPLAVTPDQRLDVGGHYHVEAVRGDQGWRISALRFTLVWTSGSGTPVGEFPERTVPPTADPGPGGPAGHTA
ncbi:MULTISPECIES: nuclear transport factor 2 family protein [unclassified Micromonospora]|uniref:nuclear transport factor 2 family protein n=1 Tax=unclassified Micromonospora TaxID=2617518 RepID=UPI00362529B8